MTLLFAPVDNTDNPILISRAQLVYGLTLPLAALLGFLLANPVSSGSLIVVLAVAGLLAFPILVRCHHPLLVFSWNAGMCLNFLPGGLDLWMVFACLSLGFAVTARMISREATFISVPSLTWPLLALGGVVFFTAMATGGIGFSVFGSGQVGGRRYLSVFTAIAGYFALTSRRIPPERAVFYAGLFFLPGILSLVGSAAYWLGPHFYFLFNLFPAGNAIREARADYSMSATVKRFAGFAYVSPALTSFMLARYGVAGVLSRAHWGRLGVFILAAAAALLGGFRSVLVMFALTLGIYFWLEGLHRTRLLPILLGLGLLGAVVVLPNTQRLPLAVQRTLSILPVTVDPIARDDAQASIDWRLALWEQASRQIPDHLWLGRGFSLDPTELFLAADNNEFDPNRTAGAEYAGDFHNGPLSLIIPFGVWGVMAFVWLLVAGGRVLYRNFRSGPEALRTVNGLLFSLFVARAIFFMVVFGSLYSELATFTGILGLSVALNAPRLGPIRDEPAARPWEGVNADE